MAVKAVGYPRDWALDNDGQLVITLAVTIANGNSGGTAYGPVAPGALSSSLLTGIANMVRDYAENSMGQEFGPTDTVRVFYAPDLIS